MGELRVSETKQFVDTYGRVHRDRFHNVITGIESVQAVGLTPPKVNSVLFEGISELEGDCDLIPALSRGSARAEEFYVNGGPATV